ncbi:hypothetical protein [Alistipes sp.]|uniref:hypothetical protein n=1 Tax=Alistipes sp. TaxID=1872444 RepID=UPI0025C02A1C|nr:hypothetical protein [Alistipes sp.]
MKNFFFKAALFLTMPLMAASFVSCDDDDTPPPAPQFKSELIGTYTPTFINYQLPMAESAQDYYFIIEPTWKEGVKPETLMVGGFLPMPQVLGIMQGLVSNIIMGGFVELDLKNNGSFSAKYKSLILPENADMSAIMGALLEPKFEETVKVFPSLETEAVIPAAALGYYTDDNADKFYFTISKDFLKMVGEKMEQPTNLVELIEGVIASSSLDIQSTEKYFAIPLKYTVESKGALTLYIDLGMIKPYLPLIKAAVANVPPIMNMINLKDTIDLIFNNVSELKMKLLLQKK